MLVHNTNLVPLRQLAIFDAEYPSEAAVAPTATHLANWWPDNKLQTVTCACVHTGTAQVLLPVRLVPFVTTMRAQHCAVARYVHIYICIYVYIYIVRIRLDEEARERWKMTIKGRVEETKGKSERGLGMRGKKGDGK